MDECNKMREVIPDLISKIGKTREIVIGIWRSIEKLDKSLNGILPDPPQCAEARKDDHELGSIETLERMVAELSQLVNDADLELREKLNLLLGAG